MMQAATAAVWRCPPTSGQTVRRVVLSPGEACRLPAGDRLVRVLAGHAWVTFAGNDLLLTPGECRGFASSKDRAVLSPLGDAPIIVEVQG